MVLRVLVVVGLGEVVVQPGAGIAATRSQAARIAVAQGQVAGSRSRLRRPPWVS